MWYRITYEFSGKGIGWSETHAAISSTSNPLDLQGCVKAVAQLRANFLGAPFVLFGVRIARFYDNVGLVRARGSKYVKQDFTAQNPTETGDAEPGNVAIIARMNTQQTDPALVIYNGNEANTFLGGPPDDCINAAGAVRYGVKNLGTKVDSWFAAMRNVSVGGFSMQHGWFARVRAVDTKITDISQNPDGTVNLVTAGNIIPPGVINTPLNVRVRGVNNARSPLNKDLIVYPNTPTSMDTQEIIGIPTVQTGGRLRAYALLPVFLNYVEMTKEGETGKHKRGRPPGSTPGRLPGDKGLIDYNPCGHIVCALRVGYKRPCRFFSDSPEVGEITWYEVPKANPVLPYVSGIVPLNWEYEQEFDTGYGEVPLSEQTKYLGTAPKGWRPDHVCGTAEQFERGTPYLPDRVPVRYGSYGLPLCCAPPLRPRGGPGASGRAHPIVVGARRCYGGGGAGGRATVEVVPLIVPFAGGVEVGGAWGVSESMTVPWSGGVEVGGAWGVSESIVVPFAGGIEIGGAWGVIASVPVPWSGGIEIGGAWGVIPRIVVPFAGGVEIGGAWPALSRVVVPFAGGIGLGGAWGVIPRIVVPFAGGIEIGGAWGVIASVPVPFAGGIEVGGEWGVTETPPPTPGATCAAAATIVTGTTYSYSITGSGTQQWFTLVAPISGTMHITTTGVGVSVSLASYEGGSCPFPSPILYSLTGPPTWRWTATAGDVLRFSFSNFSGTNAYTFVVDTGP